MKSTSLRGAVVIAVLFLLAACGKGNSTNNTAVCAQTANMTLFTSSSGTMLLSSITVTAQQYAVSVPPVPVWVAYIKPPVAVILAGYPADGVDPLTMGIDIVQIGASTDNPLQFNTTFNASRAKATYHAVLRFVATDQAVTGPLDCQDVPVTFTVQ